MIPQNLATLIHAVCRVSPKLVSNFKHTTNVSELKYMNERTFAYELYRQWQDAIDENEEGLIVNAEVAKRVEDEIFSSKLSEIFGLTKDGKPHRCFYPDLVLHHSQYDSEKQEIICEIKTMDGIDDKDNNRLNQDFKKLAAYMTENTLLYHPFKVGVFILVGGNIAEIVKRYKSDNLVDKKKNEIYCITYNVKKIEENIDVPDVVCKSLNDILNDENK